MSHSSSPRKSSPDAPCGNAPDKPGAASPDTACRGCGTCCRKGGPTLHAEDMDLFRAAHLIPEYCLTLRKGELARDLDGQLRPLAQELVKLRPRGASRPGDWTCLFLDESADRCLVYAQRPAECRALLCRDTRAIEALHGVDRASRLDVLAAWATRAAAAATDTDGPGGTASTAVPWAELLTAHEERCGYPQLEAVGEQLRAAAERARKGADAGGAVAAATSSGLASESSASPSPTASTVSGVSGASPASGASGASPSSPLPLSGADEAREAFLDAVRFDLAFRSLLRERAGVMMEELDFLLGRPLAATAVMYGIAVRMTADGPELVALPG